MYPENRAVKSDIVIWDRKEKEATLVEVSVPNDAGLKKAESEKIKKYQGFMYGMKRSWNLKKISIIPVIIETARILKRSLG